MATKTLNITLEFLQNQLDNTSFSYKILNNGNAVTYTGTSYTGTVDTVDKTFLTGSSSTNKYLMSFNDNITPNINDNNIIALGFDQPVQQIKKQSTGKYIVSGGFTKYQGVTLSSRGICRLNADFSLDSTFTPPDYSTIVYTIDIDSNDKIYVGGYDTIGGKAYLQRLNANGILDTSYLNGIGFNNVVTVVKLDPNGKLLVGGVFTTFSSISGGTVNAKGLIRLNTDGSKDVSFSGVNQGFTNGSNPAIPRSIDFQSTGKIIVGGDFVFYNNNGVENIVRLNTNGSFNTSPTGVDLSPTGNYEITKVLVAPDDSIFIAGNFQEIGGSITQYKLGKLDSSGIYDATFDVGVGLDSKVNDLAFNAAGNLVVVGNFFSYSGGTYAVPQMMVVNPINGAISPDGELRESLGPMYGINCLLVDGDKFIVGGNFTQYQNTNVYEDQYNIQISGTSLQTQQRTFDNLSFWNKNDAIVYSQTGNVITVAYTYDDADLIVVDPSYLFDIPGYLIIRINGANIPTQVEVTNQPQSLTPAYNPITFRFTSNYATEPSFRYLVNLYNEDTNDLIGKFNVAPQLDYSGYIDLSKIVSNALTVDFDPTLLVDDDATNSYINFKVGFGGEYGSEWRFNHIESYSGTPGSPYSGYTNLFQTNLIAHTYQVNDQIVVTSNSNTDSVNGLHTVLEVNGDYSIIIDLPFVNGTNYSTTGTTAYADNRKTSFPNNVYVSGLTAFNGARSWMDFINWKANNYTVVDDTGSSRDLQPKFLTDLPLTGFSMTTSQDMWLDFYNEDSNPLKISFITDKGVTGESETISGTNKVMQVAAGPNQLGIDCDANYYQFWISDDSGFPLTKLYKIDIDTRTKIENYEIAFMDRMGSIVSYAFQLRAYVKGGVEREMFKQVVNYTLSQENYLDAYDINGRGNTISNVSVTKDYELNTNWMTDEMSQYFEQLITSPFTWIKIDGIYYACTVSEKDFEVARQKNKNLIKKTITVRLSNDNVINI